MQTQVQQYAKCHVKCTGILDRIAREAIDAAVTPRSEEREKRLDFWHAMQRKYTPVYYRNGLFKKRSRKGDEVLHYTLPSADDCSRAEGFTWHAAA